MVKQGQELYSYRQIQSALSSSPEPPLLLAKQTVSCFRDSCSIQRHFFCFLLRFIFERRKTVKAEKTKNTDFFNLLFRFCSVPSTNSLSLVRKDGVFLHVINVKMKNYFQILPSLQHKYSNRDVVLEKIVFGTVLVAPETVLKVRRKNSNNTAVSSLIRTRTRHQTRTADDISETNIFICTVPRVLWRLVALRLLVLGTAVSRNISVCTT